MALIDERIAELEALFERSAPDNWAVIAGVEKDFDAILRIRDEHYERTVWLRFSIEAMEDDLFERGEAIFTALGEQWLRMFFSTQLDNLDDKNGTAYPLRGCPKVRQ